MSELHQFLAASQRISLFLDFDGVLVEIAERPDAVRVPPRLRSQLERLGTALGGALAIISGRSVRVIDEMLSPVRVAVAGDHGNERRRPNGEVVRLNPAASAAAPELAARIRSMTCADDGLLVEEKPSAVALHYRAAPQREQEAKAIMAAAMGDDPLWTAIAGKMVIEARASGASKGHAVRAYMQEPPFSRRVPIFVGDDVTDEDGFAAVQEMGGAGVKVGPGATVARYRIAGTADVPALLDLLAQRREYEAKP